MKSLIVLLLCGISALWSGHAATAPLQINDSATRVPLTGYFEVFRDPTGLMDFEQARQQTFTQVPGPLVLGYTRDALWLRFTVQAAPDMRRNERWLEILFPLLDYVSLYTPDDNGAHQRA